MEGTAGKHHPSGFTHSHITHHHDGSHTMHHVHHEGPHKDVHHAVGDHDAMMDSMIDHTGVPNAGEAADEAAADGGMHGVPAEHAAPAGLPMPPAAGA